MTPTTGFGRIVAALRWPIALAWIATAALTTAFLPSIEESQTGALGDLVPNDAAAIDAELRSAELFGFPLLSRTIVVQRDPDGLSAAAQASTLNRAITLNQNMLPGLGRVGGAIPVLNTVSIPPFTREKGTTAVTYLFFEPDVGAGERIALAERVAERAEAVAPPAGDRRAAVSGSSPTTRSSSSRASGCACPKAVPRGRRPSARRVSWSERSWRQDSRSWPPAHACEGDEDRGRPRDEQRNCDKRDQRRRAALPAGGDHERSEDREATSWRTCESPSLNSWKTSGPWKNSTNGRASPSLSPDSRLSVRRTTCGTRAEPTTLPRSVGSALRASAD